MIYNLMMLFWKIDDLFPFWTPFSWLGDRFEDYGLEHGHITIRDLEERTKEVKPDA